MEFFETMLPAYHFYIYFVFGMLLVTILRFVFKKSETYYIIFLSTILLCSWFSKDLFTMLPYDSLDVARIVAKMFGSLFGILAARIWFNKRKSERRIFS